MITAQDVRSHFVASLSADADIAAAFTTPILTYDPIHIDEATDISLSVLITAEANLADTLGDLDGTLSYKATQFVLLVRVWRDEQDPVQIEKLYTATGALVKALQRYQVDDSPNSYWNGMNGNTVNDAGNPYAKPIPTIYGDDDTCYVSRTLVTLTGQV